MKKRPTASDPKLDPPWRWWIERAIALLAAGGGVVAFWGLIRGSAPTASPVAQLQQSTATAVLTGEEAAHRQEIAEPSADPTIDDLIGSIRATSLKFYPSGYVAPGRAERKYATSLPPSTLYVGYELVLAYRPSRTSWQFPMSVTYLKPDGTPLCEKNSVRQADANASGDTYWSTCSGQRSDGRWPPGQYQVVVQIRETALARGAFTID